MYNWKDSLGVIGNIKALISDHNSTYCNTENYHATDAQSIEKHEADILETEQMATDSYLNNVAAEQEITELALAIEELKRRN